MALVLQTVFPPGSYVPFERPPQNVTLWSAIPRGLQSFVAGLNVLDVKPVNDDALLSLQMSLPANYGYVMADIGFTLIQDRAADWGAVTNLNIQNFYRGTTATDALNGNYASDMDVQFNGLFGGGAQRVLTRRDGCYPTFPIIGVDGVNILLNFQCSNTNNTVSTAGIFHFYISFWQFDLEQIRKYPINSPTPVHAR